MRHVKSIILFWAVLSIASVASGAAFWDDFESYNVGEIHGKGAWQGWDNTASAGAPVSTAQAYSGTKSIEIVPSADLVNVFDVTGGKWVLTAMQYIPSGSTGTSWFILLNQYPASQDWSVQIQFNLGTGAISSQYDGNASADIVYDQWIPIKAVIDLDLNTVDEYYNGELFSTHTWDGDNHVTLQAIDLYGNNASSIYYDDLKIESFLMSMTAATHSIPASTAVDVTREASLTWTPGYFAASHDVYFGINYDDVANATRTNPLNVLASRSQTQSQFTPETRLDFDQTYYWRVDEVNAAPDNTIFAGEVWSFTAEPYAIPIEAITATASGANPDMEASKTIDGSGLNELNQHSTEPTAMWLAPTNGSWIQYEFDKAYKLHEMVVWNSNQVVEPFIGFGLKEISIETSLDGATWIPVQGVQALARGTGLEDYQANTTVALSGTMAKYVKITPQSVYGFAGLSGLSEVRFLSIPTFARTPQPADQSISTGANVALTWRSGREAASSDVYLGAAADDLALLGTVSDNQIASGPLDYDQTYYWQVTEINEAEAPSSYAGAVWRFTTPASGAVDDFESYSGEEGQEVFMTWFDGFGGDASLGGSITGHADGPFVETTLVYGGRQSMPFYYDNDGSFADIDGNVSSPSFSEVIREFDSPQDWTASSVKSLSIMFRGETGNTGQLYCKIGNTKLLYDGDAANLGIATWSAWNIDLSTVGGNLTSVRELSVGIEGGGAGLIYLDEIRLYAQLGELINPDDPVDEGLVGAWSFDEGNGTVAADSSGNGHDGTLVGATWAAGKQGSALSVTASDYMETTYAGITGTASRTCCAWIKTVEGNRTIMSWGKNTTGNKWRMRLDATNGLRVEVNGGYHYGVTALNNDEWHHVAVVLKDDGSANVTDTVLYVDGLPDVTSASQSTAIDTDATGVVQVGKAPYHSSGFIGLIDDARVYDRALLGAEIMSLAGVLTTPQHKPF